MAKKRGKKYPKQVETLTHSEAKRTNIPSAEFQSVMAKDNESPIQVAYQRRNRDLDPQLVWRGKDMVDWSDLIAMAPPLFIQEKIHPKALIDDLLCRSEQADAQKSGFQTDLFADFNGLPDDATQTDFYQHEGNWTNRMILGDSLQVMASLAEREGLRGKVQCIWTRPTGSSSTPTSSGRRRAGVYRTEKQSTLQGSRSRSRHSAIRGETVSTAT